MLKAILSCKCSSFLNKKQLLNLKKKAVRSGAWFKALQRIDRVLFDLTIKIVVIIRSSKLVKSMLMVIGKLENSVKSSFSMHLKEIGLPIAQKMGSIAQRLGNTSAVTWAVDASFISFLGTMKINDAKVFKQ